MRTGLKVALGLTAAMLVAFVIEAAYIHYDRNRPAQTTSQPDYGPSDPDDLVFLKRKHPYTQPEGVLPGAAPLKIVEVFQQARPKGLATRVPAGTGQVLLEFTMPKSADPGKLHAAPVGYRDASGYNFFTDDMFFYDDPHTLWDWSPQIWHAIDWHQVIAGMNQRQVSLSLGAIARQSSGEYGNGQMIYANAGHPVAVTFEKGKVTASHPAESF